MLPIGVLAQLGREVMRLTLRPWPFMVSSVLSAVVGARAAIYLVTAGTAELQEVQWGALVGAVLASIYGIVVVRGELARPTRRVELRVMLRYGLPLVPSGLALWGLALLDRFILEKLDGLDEVGLYGVANRAASVALLAVVAFTTAWGPFMLSLHADDAEEERRVRARVLVYVAVLFGFVALLLGLFAREALDIVAPSFEGAANAVGLLALGLACQGVGRGRSRGHHDRAQDAGARDLHRGCSRGQRRALLRPHPLDRSGGGRDRDAGLLWRARCAPVSRCAALRPRSLRAAPRRARAL